MKSVPFEVCSLVLFFFCLSVCSCSTAKPDTKAQTDAAHLPTTALSTVGFLSDGSITIAGPVPPITADASPDLPAFLPASDDSNVWLNIGAQDSAVLVMEGDQRKRAVSVEGRINLTPGSYQIVHKQRSAPWYAPDEYFLRRKLPIPPAGDKARFLRGALGDYALFIDQDTPIHCGPIWTEDVGGLLLPDQDCAKLYYELPIGALVRIE